jgi:RimJ/RimL family protein N-acetyltransferase
VGLTTVIETERLTLRRAVLADAGWLLGLWNDAAYIQFIRNWGVRTMPEAEALLQTRIIDKYTLHGFGQYVVALKATGEPMGLTGLIRRPGLDDVDVGYAYLPQYWGKGYASEAVAAVMAYGRATLGLPRIVGIVDPANARSIHVLEKAGLRYTRMITLPGDTMELKLFT